MSNKNVEDYLTEGMHGTRLPKQAERNYYLGTLRERIIIALKIGEVMRDKGLEELEQAMQEYPESKLIFNGSVANRFQVEEKKLAAKYNITYTEITDTENKTDIGAVLALDKAINRDNIYLEDLSPKETDRKEDDNKDSSETPSSTFFSKLKDWLS